jgi:two-component system LytT family response regulator
MLRALVVDDDAPARDRLRGLLAAHEDIHVVGQADDGVSALERIATLRPDLVFLDIEMPGLGGLEVAAALASSAPSAWQGWPGGIASWIRRGCAIGSSTRSPGSETAVHGATT